MTKTWPDTIRWIIVALLVIAGVVANSVYASQSLTLRLVGWIVLICATLLLISQTSQGTQVVSFAKQSRLELRKVVWPTRQETVQTTMIVVVMVSVVSVVLWLIDLGFLWLIALLTGNR